MTFFKEGRRSSYSEVVETLKMLIKQNILSELETEEVYKVFLRLFSCTEDALENYLKEVGYRTKSSKQTFFTASRLNMVSDLVVWERAIQLKEDIEANKQVDKEILVEFISEPYYQAMKILNIHLEDKHRSKH